MHHRHTLFDISVTDRSIAMRGMGKSGSHELGVFPRYFGKLEHIRIWVDLRADLIQSTMDEYGQWLDQYIRYIDEHPDFVDDEPSPDLYEDVEKFEIMRARDNVRQHLREVCFTLRKGKQSLQSLTVIVNHKNPKYLVD